MIALWRVQPLLCNRRINNSVVQPVSRQRIGKRVPAAMVTHATGETGCCLRGPRRGVIKKRTGATSSVELCKRRLRRDGSIVE
jgi:hypothetical protein